jgi:WD40 repeat protein
MQGNYLSIIVLAFLIFFEFQNKLYSYRYYIRNRKLQASLIEPNGSRSPPNRPLSWQSNDDSSSGQIIDYNWKYGMCQHKVSFEGAQTIRRLKFCGDLLAFSFIDGKVCLIRLSSGDVLDKFNEHSGEVTSIDFDGLHLCSGGSDGTLCFYSLSYNQSKEFGSYLHKFPQLFARSITGVRIMTIKKKSELNDENDTIYVASCSLDKRLICVDFNT